MSGRLYASPVVGSGAYDDPYRPLLLDLLPAGTPTSTLIGGDADGHPRAPFCLVWADASDWSGADADPRLLHVDLAELDNPVPGAWRERMRQAGLAGAADLAAGRSVRHALDLHLARHVPGVDVRRFLDAALSTRA